MVNEIQQESIPVTKFSTTTTQQLLDRFEAKYIIPIAQIDSIVRFLMPYCSYDKYSADSQDRFYKVNSLYFDTPEYLLLKRRMTKSEKRFNMRIRSYGDDSCLPFFLEIKQRIGDIVRKTRGRVNNPDFADYFETASGPQQNSDGSKNSEHTELFYRTAHRYNASPVVLVQYRRQAFFSNYDEYARVTFDLDLKCMAQTRFDPSPVESIDVSMQCGVRF